MSRPIERKAAGGRTASPQHSHWFLVPRPASAAAIRLFCLPYAGGGASIYRRWAERLPEEIELCAVQLPGHETRLDEEPFDRIEPLLEALELAMLPYLDRPVVLFGHSMGAILSFELTRALHRRGAAPRHLFVSGRAAPQLTEHRPFIHNLPPARFLEEVYALEGTPPEILGNRELIHALLPVMQADFALIERWTHAPREPLPVPMTAVGGVTDPRVGRAELEGWGAHTCEEFALHLLPGGHFFLRESEAALVELVAARCGGLPGPALAP